MKARVSEVISGRMVSYLILLLLLSFFFFLLRCAGDAVRCIFCGLGGMRGIDDDGRRVGGPCAAHDALRAGAQSTSHVHDRLNKFRQKEKNLLPPPIPPPSLESKHRNAIRKHIHVIAVIRQTDAIP